MKTKKKLVCCHLTTYWDSNYVSYYFKDENESIYEWYTKSDKAFEEIRENTVINASFKELSSWINQNPKYKLGTKITTIQNVRW